MQFPPVSLDSLLPATNAAAPPAAEGGGFAQALQTSESALRSPAADVPGKSPQQEKSLAGRGEGEARQASDDRGAGLASRERSAGAAVSPPGVNLPAVESLAGAATEAVPLPAEMAFAADFPAPEPVAATAPASPPTSEPPTSFIAPAGEPSRDAALLLSAPATVEPGKSVADLRAMPPERGASAPLPEPRVEGATTAIPKREDLHTAQQAAPAVNLASSDARMTASAVPAPEAAPHGETSGRTVLVEAAEATARGQADAPPRVSPPVSEFAGTRSAGGGDRAGAETVIAGALTSEGEPLSAGTNKSAIPAPAPEAPVPAGMKPEEAAPAVDLSGRAASPPPPEFRPPSAGGQAASAPAPEPPMPAGMKPEEAAPAVDLSGRAASPPPPEFRPPSAGGQAVSAPAPEPPVPAGMKPEEASPAVGLSGRAASPSPPEFRPPSAGGQAVSAPAPEPPLPAGMKPEEAASAVDLSGRAASPPPPEFRPPSAGGQAASAPAPEPPLPAGMKPEAVSTPETISAPLSAGSESVLPAQKIVAGRFAPEPAAAPVADRPIRQEGAAPLPGLRSGDGAVIESFKVTAPAIPASPTGPVTQTVTAALSAAAVPVQEPAAPARLREDPRGSRLETSSDRRFAQLLGETRGAVRVSAAQGESLPVMDAAKGEGAELLFREPGAHAEIFRAAAGNGSNPPVFSVAGQGAATPQASFPGPGTPAAATPFTLPVPEEQVYQQVASRLTLVDGERHSRVTMRLYPEELGQVKLELTVEGDRVRVRMHAQNQQVQEVLEKYLPRLRESFEQQGLKLEEAQVTSDSPGQGGRGSFQESRQSFFASRSASRSARAAGEEEPVVSPPPSPANLRPGGISVRV